MFQDVRYIDAWGNLRAFPFLVFVLFSLLLLSRYMKYECKVSELQDSISRELDEMIDRSANVTGIEELRTRLSELRQVQKYKGYSEKEHLEDLLKLREEISQRPDMPY